MAPLQWSPVKNTLMNKKQTVQHILNLKAKHIPVYNIPIRKSNKHEFFMAQYTVCTPHLMAKHTSVYITLHKYMLELILKSPL